MRCRVPSDSPAGFLESPYGSQGHQIEQGLLALLFHEIREPLKLTSQNEAAK
jgi:hypothetical protein